MSAWDQNATPAPSVENGGHNIARFHKDIINLYQPLKVDTITENTSGSGVSIDGVELKDSNITASSLHLTSSGSPNHNRITFTNDTNPEAASK